MGAFDDRPGMSLLGGAAHFYDTYETADGGYVAVACIEPGFYGHMIELLGLDADEFLPHGFKGVQGKPDVAAWAALKGRLAETFRGRTRDEWMEIFAGSDACVSPVLSLGEAPGHPHNAARQTFVEVAGVMQNAPAPRFSRTPAAMPRPAAVPGADTVAVLEEAGVDEASLRSLSDRGIIPVIDPGGAKSDDG